LRTDEKNPEDGSVAFGAAKKRGIQLDDVAFAEDEDGI
jgi:hypothetical protein